MFPCSADVTGRIIRIPLKDNKSHERKNKGNEPGCWQRSGWITSQLISSLCGCRLKGPERLEYTSNGLLNGGALV